jgi:hypothetical protein
MQLPEQLCRYVHSTCHCLLLVLGGHARIMWEEGRQEQIRNLAVDTGKMQALAATV